jgi:hypothetical protein
MEIIKQAEAMIADLANGQGVASILDARSMLSQLVDEMKAYQEGSEEAYGVLVETKRELESKVKQQQSTILAQQDLIKRLQTARIN